LVGNALHHYNTSLFGWAIPYLAPFFFPQATPSEALFFIFALLPLTYMGKPLGAFFWGWLGDRWGKKPVLMGSLVGMALSSVIVACLPCSSGKYLILCRFLQSFCSIGEASGAILYLLEHTAPEKRYRMSSFHEAFGVLGICISAFLVGQMSLTQWRLLFAFGGVIAAVAIVLRKNSMEHPEFKSSTPSWNRLWRERKTIFSVVLVSGFSYAYYFMVTLFLNGWIPRVTAATETQVLLANTYLLWVDFVLLLIFGFFYRKVRLEHLMIPISLLISTFLIPAFLLFPGASWSLIIFLRLGFILLGTALAAPYQAWKFHLLPRENRLFVTSITATLGAQLGSPLPAMVTYLFNETGNIGWAISPLVGMGALATWIIYQRKERLAYQ